MVFQITEQKMNSTEHQARAIIAAIDAIFAPANLAKARGQPSLLVQEMVDGTEVILGARTDPQFGPFLMVGLGGIFVEVLKDVALRLLPVDDKEALAMLRELKGYRVLEGVRGQPRRDIAALVRAEVGSLQ